MSKRNGWLESVPIRQVPQRRYSPLAQKVPKTYAFQPLSACMYLAEHGNTEWCPEHTDCIRVTTWNDGLVEHHGLCRCRTLNPINIQADMPGTNHTLDLAGIDCGEWYGTGVWLREQSRHFKVDDNASTDIWKVDGDRITFANAQFFKNRYGTSNDPLNVDISAYTELGVEFVNHIIVNTGWYRTHIRSPFIVIHYIPSTPPELATVILHVTNRSTGVNVRGALVQILDGTTVIASGSTNSSGDCTLIGIPALDTGLSYSLIITAGNYYEYTDSVTVKPGTNRVTAKLVPVPGTPLPWWLWYVVGGAVIIGGTAIGYAALKGRQQEKVIIVR